MQQKQGRVKSTFQAKGVNINDDKGLEREADQFGALALANTTGIDENYRSNSVSGSHEASRADQPVQRVIRLRVTSDCTTTTKPRGTIRILDNRTFVERNLSITLPTNSRLTIEATHGLRPTISSIDSLDIHSTGKNTHLILNGLLIHCPLRLQNDIQLEVVHCTIAPHGIEIQRHTPHLNFPDRHRPLYYRTFAAHAWSREFEHSRQYHRCIRNQLRYHHT